MPYPTYNTLDENGNPKKTLEKHQDCLREIYTLNTTEEFDNYPARIKDYDLPEVNVKTLEGVVENQRRIRVKPTGEVPAVKSRAEQIKEDYKDVDAENFSAPVTPTPDELEEAGIKVEVSGGEKEQVKVTATTPIDDPLDAIPQAKEPEPPAPEEKPKRTRSKVTSAEPTTTGVRGITIKRRINLPIKGVDYSNNEFGFEVEAGTRDEALAEYNELYDILLADAELVRKSQVDEMLKNHPITPQIKEVEKIIEKVVYQRSPEDDLELRRYARVKLFMNKLSADPNILPIMQKVKEEFEKMNPRF